MEDSSKVCKTCDNPYVPTGRNQKNCPSCRDKKEILKIQEKMLREIKGFSCINICEDCWEPFGASSPHQKWCSSCKNKRNEFVEGERKIRATKPIRNVICECGNEFETVSSNRVWCDDCIKLRKSKSVYKYITIPINYSEDPELGKYIERQNRLADKWNKRYRDCIGVEVDPSPNMSGAIYNG